MSQPIANYRLLTQMPQVLTADFHWVSVPEGRDSECIRRFCCFTADLYAMADWLKTCGLKRWQWKPRSLLILCSKF